MPYKAQISRNNPSCFLFLLDQSESMVDPFGPDAKITKAAFVADAINKILHNLILRCTKGPSVWDYFEVGVIGYGNSVGPALGGRLTGQTLVPISQVAASPFRLEERTKKVSDGAGGLVDQRIKFPIWFEARAAGSTPMCEALYLASQTVRGFLARFPDCFPPVVMNLTDGAATDGDPASEASGVTAFASSDGGVLLFNLHASSNSQARPILFPQWDRDLPDDYARGLFQVSSFVPEPMAKLAQGVLGTPLDPSARGFVYNADAVAIVQFLEIGTRAAMNLR